MIVKVNKIDKQITVELDNDLINEYAIFKDNFTLNIYTEISDDLILINYLENNDLGLIMQKLDLVNYLCDLDNDLEIEMITENYFTDTTINRINSLIEKYENSFITNEILDLLWNDTVIKNVESNGLSGKFNNTDWYTIYFINGENIDIYIERNE